MIDSLLVCTDMGFMTVHKFAPPHFYNSIGPALRIGDGDTIVTGTLDGRGFYREGPLGPFVQTCEPGNSSAAPVEAAWQSMTLS